MAYAMEGCPILDASVVLRTSSGSLYGMFFFSWEGQRRREWNRLARGVGGGLLTAKLASFGLLLVDAS